MASIEIFFCYAREDEALVNQLKRHLIPLQRQRLIDIWYDRDISAGTEWELEIKEHLNSAQIILLLVSPDFMASDYCYGVEMRRALERHEQKEVRVIPVILRPVCWQIPSLHKLQALPLDAKPVVSSSWHYQDEAFFNVTEGTRIVAVKVMSSLTPSSLTLPIKPSEPEPTETPANVLQQQAVKPDPLVTPEDFSWLCIGTLTGHKGSVDIVAISPDGQMLSSGSEDQTIKLWNLKTGDLLRTPTVYEHLVLSVAISADEQTLASGSYDHTIKQWKRNDLILYNHPALGKSTFLTGRINISLTSHWCVWSGIRPQWKLHIVGEPDQYLRKQEGLRIFL